MAPEARERSFDALARPQKVPYSDSFPPSSLLPVNRSVAVRSGPASCPYSPERVEEAFSEVRDVREAGGISLC